MTRIADVLRLVYAERFTIEQVEKLLETWKLRGNG